MRTNGKKILLAVLALVVLAGILFAIPPIRERVMWRVDQLRVSLFYKFNPPEKEVFVPQEAQERPTATPTLAPTFTSTPEEPVDTPTPQPTATPLPDEVAIEGVTYTDQHGLWNYCAPANLAMQLSFWGWEGDRVDIGSYVKPFEKDKNVMAYELADYANEQTDLQAVLRSGGTLDLLQKLLANGYPVLIEKGTYIRETSTGKLSWMGHYNVLTGYSNETQEFVVQDSYYTPDYRVAFSLLADEWRAFNNVFVVVYPSEKQDELFEILGEYADTEQSNRIAAQTASDEIYALSDANKFFAWFNRGTSLVALQDYYGAAAAYDDAWSYYATLPEEGRPWRITWYQTGPYFAYFYTGRYQDLINLATQTIDGASQPYLEENFYWRAQAYAAMGDIDLAVQDLKTSLEYHPDFVPSVNLLQELGYSE